MCRPIEEGDHSYLSHQHIPCYSVSGKLIDLSLQNWRLHLAWLSPAELKSAAWSWDVQSASSYPGLKRAKMGGVATSWGAIPICPVRSSRASLTWETHLTCPSNNQLFCPVELGPAGKLKCKLEVVLSGHICLGCSHPGLRWELICLVKEQGRGDILSLPTGSASATSRWKTLSSVLLSPGGLALLSFLLL